MWMENTKRKGLPLISGSSSSCLAKRLRNVENFENFLSHRSSFAVDEFFCRRKCLSVFSGETEIYRTTLRGISIFGAKEGEWKSYDVLCCEN